MEEGSSQAPLLPGGDVRSSTRVAVSDPGAPQPSISSTSTLSALLNALHQASTGQGSRSLAPGLPRLQLRLQHSDVESDEEVATSSSAATANSLPDAEAGARQPVAAEGAADSQAATVSGRQDSTNVAAAAERHRLSNATVIDLQATARWVESSLSFFGLLLLVFLYYHIVGLMVFVWLTFVLVKANEQLRRQVALKQRSALRKSVLVAIAVGLHVPAVLWLLRSAKLWNLFIFVPPQTVETVWDAFYYVAVVDALIRYCGMVLKVGLLLLLPMSSAEKIRQRGQVLTFVEHALLLYRAATPITVWYMYYVSQKLPPAFFAGCTGAYGMFKLSMLYERLVAMFASLKLILHPEGQYGQYATEQEVAEAGNQCAICQEPMLKPIKLQCTHLFCEACIAEWFERERTCPMCRAVAKPAGLTSFKDSGTSLLPQLF